MKHAISYQDCLPPKEWEADRKRQEEVDRIALSIWSNSDRKMDLLMDDDLERCELVEAAVRADEAWPVIERLHAGMPISIDEFEKLPALFRAIRNIHDRLDVIIHQAAEDDLDAA